jgi:predicted transcriptional regulator
MCNDFDSACAGHTIVWSECEAGQQPDPRSDAFLALIRHYVEKDTRTLSELAETLGISRRQLGRVIDGKKPMRLAELRALTDILDIDRARATVAIEMMGDWQSYDDPGLCIVMRMLKSVVTKLHERADFSLEPLTEPAQDKFTDWLADSIITNEVQIRDRRNAFMKLPQL